MTIEQAINEFPGNGSDAAMNSEASIHTPPRRKSSARKSGADSQRSSETQDVSAVGTLSRKGGDPGQFAADTHPCGAGIAKKRRSKKAAAADIRNSHPASDTQKSDAVSDDPRFSDPLIAAIVLQHRTRVRWMKARNGLILQGKAYGRAYFDGDKKEGAAAFDRIRAGKMKPGDEPLADLLVPFLPAIEHFEASLKRTERDLEKLAKKLPIMSWLDTVKGFGAGSLAAIVGECGDIGAYRTVSGVWRRLGLAPYAKDGANHAGMTWRVEKWREAPALTKDEWSDFGYSGRRRSVAWNAGEPIAKLQRTWVDKETGEVKKPADHYGLVLEEAKEKALAKGWTPGHAEAHARRVMFKRVLRDLWVAWNGLADRGSSVNRSASVGEPDNSVDPSRSGSDTLSNCAGIDREAA